MESKIAECMVQDEREPFRRVALLLESGEGVEAQIRALEHPHNRLADIDNAGELPVGFPAYQERNGATDAHAIEVFSKLRVRLRSEDPWLVQLFAVLRSRDKS